MKFRQSAFEVWTLHRDVFIALSLLLSGALFFALVTLYPPPASVTKVLIYFSIQAGLLLLVFLNLVFAQKGIVWEFISLVFVIVLFSLPLIYKWQTATFTGFMLGGLLPFSDAHGYYAGAQNLMTGDDLNEVATRRPLFTGFLSVLLTFTGNNLQISLTILAVVHGVATFFAAREIQRVHTSLAAALFVVICYWYYCGIAGTAITENLGFGFGCLGLAFLLQGAQRNTLWKIGFGFFLLALALNIRAGAFFILPALLLWFWITYKKDFGWKGLLFVSMAVVVAMTCNVIVKRGIGNPEGVLFSNYSHTLYGLASGNAGWQQVLTDHPNVKEDEIFGLAINKIKREPALFGLGMARAFQDYFRMHSGAFSFMRLIGDPDIGNHLLWILTWMGVATVLFDLKKPLSWMVLLAFFGILSSTVLVPPRDANAMRVYAATMPVTAYLASLGILLPATLLKKPGFVSSQLSAGEWKTDHLLLPFSAGLLVVCLILPFVIKNFGRAPQADRSLACTPDDVQILFLMGRGASVRLMDDQEVNESYLPAISVSDFRNGTQGIPRFYPSLARELLNLAPGNAISVGGFRKITSQDLEPLQAGFLITDGQLLPPGPHQICVRPAKDENLRDSFFYYFSASGEESQDVSFVQKDPSLTKAIRSFYALGLFAILLGLFDFWAIPPARKIFVLGNMALIITGILVNLHATAIYPLTWERRLLPAHHMFHERKYSYKIDLGMDWIDRRLSRGSLAAVYENGAPLKRPYSSLPQIRQRGKGRFSVENGYLFFSASDNSDPQKNGRTYEIYWPTPIPSLYRYGFYILSLVGVFFLVKYLPRRMRDRG